MANPIPDAKLRELIALAKQHGHIEKLVAAVPAAGFSEEGEEYAIAAFSLAVPLAEEVLALRAMLNHAAACEVRNPAECNECKDIWLKGYPYAQ